MNNLLNFKEFFPSLRASRSPLNAIESELDKTFSEMKHLLASRNFTQFEDLTISPSMDIVEDRDNFKVEFEMPGIDEKDIKVSIDDGTLTVSAEKTISRKNQDKSYLMREIGYGSYERTCSLPDHLDISRAAATMKKGMLWVTIPKTEEYVKQSRQISVKKVEE
jgi:HSP20 family protein